jgi:hypothetical protein
MLNKDICKACVNATPIQDGEDSWISPWVENDDVAWEKGEMSCPVSDVGSTTLVNEAPPKECPYHLEHIMSKPC